MCGGVGSHALNNLWGYIMNTTKMLVQDIEPRDHIVYNDTDTRTVEDIRENGEMNGCWLEFEDGSAMFHEYGTSVSVAVDF
jgi:hypothetical protein